jgi:hypothetical protein
MIWARLFAAVVAVALAVGAWLVVASLARDVL